jgi:hypothetical protein
MSWHFASDGIRQLSTINIDLHILLSYQSEAGAKHQKSPIVAFTLYTFTATAIMARLPYFKVPRPTVRFPPYKSSCPRY